MLLERESQIRALASALERASEGNGQLVLVAGEAGSGKTSLVEAFVEQLDDTVLVASGACDPLTTPRPLSPLYDFAADPDVGLPHIVEPGREPMDVFAEVLDRMRNTIRPIVMIVEDIHWADEATLDFLRYIGRRVADTKALVVCTYRDDEVGADHQLRPVLGQLIPLSSTTRLVVPSLTIDGVAQLIGDRPIDSIEMLRITDGNAFFVTEILASDDTLPVSVQEAVLARVSRLEEAPRRVVEAVSVAPRTLSLDHAMALVATSADDVDAALASGVLVSDAGNLRFRHELARSAVEGSLPPARRLSLHRKMIGLLEEDHDTDAARLAHHAARTHDADLVLAYAPEAARDAVGRGAIKQAIAFYEAALDFSELQEPKAVADIRVALANELGTVDRTRESVPHLEAAIDYYSDAGCTDDLARALIALSQASWRLHHDERGFAALQRALELLEPAGPSEVLAETYAQQAHFHMLARRGSEGHESLDRARSVVEAPSAEVQWNMDMLEGCLNVVTGNTRVGLDQLAQTEQIALADGSPRQVAIAQGMLGSGAGEVRAYDEALEALERSVDFGLRHDQDYSVAYSRAWQARVAFEQGRWDDVGDYAQLVAATVNQDAGIAYLTAMSALGRTRVRRGDPGALELLDDMVAVGRRHELQHAWNAICGRAEYFWLVGRPEAGLDELEKAYRRALETDSEWAHGEIGYWMWKVGAIDRPSSRAAEPFALQMKGEWEQAAQAWTSIGCPYEAAVALSESGEPELMLEALRTFGALGARPMCDSTRAELRGIGVNSIPRGPTRSTLNNPAGLTNRQIEVLELMGDHLTNADIADALFISKKTVEHHVSAILRKLEVDNRDEAVAKANLNSRAQPT